MDSIAQIVCAQLALSLLGDSSVRDQVERRGCNAAELRAELEHLAADAPPLDVDTHGSDYETRRPSRSKSAEKPRDICAVLACFNRRTITGQDLKTALSEAPKDDLVTFILKDVALWNPQQKTRKATIPA